MIRCPADAPPNEVSRATSKTKTPSRMSEGPSELYWSGIKSAAEKVAIAQSIEIAMNLRP